jgi:hypothetical protein
MSLLQRERQKLRVEPLIAPMGSSALRPRQASAGDAVPCTAVACLGLLLALATACEAAPPSASNPGGSGAGSGGGSSGAGGAGPTPPTDCTKPQAAAVRLSVLTESQFTHSVQDILKVSGDAAAGQGQAFNDVSLEQRANVAATIAAQAATSLAQWAPCTPPSAGSSPECEQQIIDKIGAKAYRHPLSEAEKAEMKKLFDAGVQEKDFATGVEWFLTGVLQSPDFVYQVVRPDPTEQPGAVRALSAHEYASRLAYFIWDGPPDDALFAAAATNDLSDATKRDAQVTRMLQDPRFSRGVEQFYTHWLKLGAFREAARDVVEFDSNVVNALSTSLLMSATELYKSPTPNISSLFSGDTYYLNDALGKFYGVSGTGATFAPAQMAGQSRRGILTHPGLMALLSRHDESFPIGRGLFVLKNIVCSIVPALPENFTPPQQPAFQEGTSTRDRLEMHTAGAFCQACHSKINPAGFVFEAFDHVGRFRTTDHGRPVDTSATLALGLDVDGTYATGDEFLAKLGESQAVRSCFAEKYLDFAVAHPVTDPADTCSIQAVGKTFGASGDLKGLVVAIAGSESFRMRLAEGVGQ